MFQVRAKGVGLPDYNARMERSTMPVLSPILRQRAGVFHYEGWLDPAFIHRFIMELPQEDGTMDWTTSSITLHYTDCKVATDSNRLVSAGLVRFASLDDFFANIVADYYPDIYGYGVASIRYSKGIRTQPGSCYGMVFRIWSYSALEYVVITAVALVTDLTPPYMVWGAV